LVLHVLLLVLVVVVLLLLLVGGEVAEGAARHLPLRLLPRRLRLRLRQCLRALLARSLQLPFR
jgi:hypothetical protein